MIVVSGFVGAQMIIYVLHAVFGFHSSWGLLHYCIAALSELTFLHSAAKIGLNVLIAYTLVMVVVTGCKQLVLERKWKKYICANRHEKLSLQLNSKYKHLDQEIIVIRHNSILAVTSGLLFPKIIISSQLLSSFSEREISAILLHEYSHCRHYDPLRMLLVKMMISSFPFIPIFKRFSHYINVWIELEADQFAVQYMRSPVDLATVLVKWSKMSTNKGVGVAFADKAINYRLLRLIEPNQAIRVPILSFSPLMISLIAIYIISCVVIFGCY